MEKPGSVIPNKSQMFTLRLNGKLNVAGPPVEFLGPEQQTQLHNDIRPEEDSWKELES